MASSEIEGLRDQIDDLDAEVRHLRSTIDKLLDHCGDPECLRCGEIICPHGEPLHFHHDGCPACCQDEVDHG